ncbi:hypothetical protein [Colwellia psychrerythraea]|uniref:Uncharacterized protein n=1 Tax=Colwellia psychrerythraea TaxID=28229 RepID=A0A099KNV9_COLPS|nr:hypothetical protein [Colwellia psychrerythraea]KGJ92131.1 hypothetical protein ND2E_3024 [Colwellia psychrerythraea]
MKTNNSTTSTPKSTPVKTPLAEVMEAAFNSVTELPWFEGFHTGKHTDRHGKAFTFSQEDLQQMVDNFEPGTVAFLTGHPEADAPSYGYAKEVKLTDKGQLYLNGDDVNVGFAQSVIAGHYGKRSLGIQFSKAKGWFIDHVAFLGAVKPALDLQSVGQYNFSAPDTPQDISEFEFSIETQTANTLVRFLRKFQAWMITNGDSEEAKAIVDEWDVDWLQRQSIREEIKEESEHSLNYSNHNNPAEDDMSNFTQADIDAAVALATKEAKTNASAQFSQQSQADKDQIALLTKQNAEMQFGQRVEKHQAWITEQIQASKLLPAQAAGMAEFMAHIESAPGADEITQFEFSQGTGKDAKTVKQSPVEFMKNMIENGAKHGLLDDELIDDDSPVNVEFASNEDLNKAVVEFQSKNDVTYSVALDSVLAGGK